MPVVNEPSMSIGDEPALPAGGRRTLVSLLLLFHFFALGVAITASPPGSPLAQAVAPLATWYLEALNMNVPYRFHLTHGEERDMDFRLEAELTLEDGSTRTMTLPADDDGAWGQRRRQRRFLATTVGELAIDARDTGIDSFEGILPHMVGRWAMQETGATKATIRCRRVTALSMDQAREQLASGGLLGAPQLRTVYEGALRRSGDRFTLVKISARGESAPAAKSAPAKAPQ